MKILFNNVAKILDEKLSLTERGLLITALLVKDNDSKMTLAKFKTKVKVSEYKTELVKLHEQHFIEWSGYKTAKKSLENKSLDPKVKLIIDFINNLYGRNFDLKSQTTTSGLKERLKKYSIEDIKLVVSNRYTVWKDDKTMSKFLCPQTIFRPSKFDKYLEEAKRTKEGLNIVNTDVINLKKGDEIDHFTAQKLVNDVYYDLIVFKLKNGKKQGLGRADVKTGKELKRTMNTIKSNIDMGIPPESIYIYNGN